MSRYYSPEGDPIAMEEWMDRFHHRDAEQRVSQVGDWLVSTIWLGLDHNYFEGPPLVWETMIFCRPGRWSWRRLLRPHPYHDEYCHRHTTRAEAFAHHETVVKALGHRFHPNELWEVIK